MRIRELFERDVFRHLNGVIKADQLDAMSVWQELDEFVVTHELKRHFEQFFSMYSMSLQRGADPDLIGNTGVWVSGFFGSGKSHFIKVLSYLLKNDEHTLAGETRRAVDFFDAKVRDPVLRKDIQRAAASSTDVILFNIDGQADRTKKDPMLQVLVRVLDKHAGYCADYPHIAGIERRLEGRGLLTSFHEAFAARAKGSWPALRHAWHFYRKEVAGALSDVLEQSAQASDQLIDTAREQFPLTVENFCKWVKEFIDRKGQEHRLVFLIDEVGQFIGTDTSLMLRLQTITEMLGTVCRGRAWIVVTSQEDIDKVVGSVERSLANDFSKIQGRFQTRLSLSSANVDEVLQRRLLAKRPEVRSTLEDVFRAKGDILKNQLSFRDVGMTMSPFANQAGFVRNYPVAPYQFKLLQKVFEAIRAAGATGKHLARGERSLLDAFQQALRLVADDPVGVLIPLYRFYPAIENFLDTSVKLTIEQASKDQALQPLDVDVLKVLFLVRFVTEVRCNVDNLVTLCLAQIDAPRLALRASIEEGLLRLERLTLISRNGDHYSFLTSEEQEVSRKIARTEVEPHKKSEVLTKLIYQEVFADKSKHRYKPSKKDFTLQREADGSVLGNRVDGALVVSVITPLADDFDVHRDPAHCLQASRQSGGQVLIRLPDDPSFNRELTKLCRTETYLRTQDGQTLPPSIKNIHQNLWSQCGQRRKRLHLLLDKHIGEAQFFAAGQMLQTTSHGAARSFDKALDYLIENTFSKMGYLDRFEADPVRSAATLLRRASSGQGPLIRDEGQPNRRALEDLTEYLVLSSKLSRRIVISDLVKRYTRRPYGWPEGEVILLLARLVILSRVQVLRGSAAVDKPQLADLFRKRGTWKTLVVRARERIDDSTLAAAKRLGHQLFHELGPNDADALVSFLKDHLQAWKTTIGRYVDHQRSSESLPDYPRATRASEIVQALLAVRETLPFLKRFLKAEPDLTATKGAASDLGHFLNHQLPTWLRLVEALRRFEQNDLELSRDDRAKGALIRLREIHSASKPFGMIQEVDDLIRRVESVNQRLLNKHRAAAKTSVKAALATVEAAIDALPRARASKGSILAPLQKLQRRVDLTSTLTHLGQATREAPDLESAARRDIARLKQRPEPEPSPPKIRDVRAAKLAPRHPLKTLADVDAFLAALRSELEQALRETSHVRIL